MTSHWINYWAISSSSLLSLCQLCTNCFWNSEMSKLNSNMIDTQVNYTFLQYPSESRVKFTKTIDAVSECTTTTTNKKMKTREDLKSDWEFIQVKVFFKLSLLLPWLKGLRRDSERLRKMTLTGTAAKAGKRVTKHPQNSLLLPQTAAQPNKPKPSECHRPHWTWIKWNLNKYKHCLSIFNLNRI